MINRYSSKREGEFSDFIKKRLKNAKSYDRIAGYFRSSILGILEDEIESVTGKIRVVCNSDLDIKDFQTINAAKNAIRKKWCSEVPEEEFSGAEEKLGKLYELLVNGKLEIKIIPNNYLGLIHGKAGVITLENGEKTSFLGSINESYSAWKKNYELLWEDDSKEAVEWVQEEFDSFWNNEYAIEIPEFIIDDINRISRRREISNIDEWRENSNPASAIVESPVYRNELGLWPHQKYFINKAFRDHEKEYGARYILADMVGLGKTAQLAMSAKLMALKGNKPILIIAPKTLIWQWQEEMNSLLDMPSAVWNGKEWVDENGIIYPNQGAEAIKKCPRRVGIISQGLITAESECVDYLYGLRYECIIVDECHRARRKNLGEGKEEQKADPNNLLKFLKLISSNTKSMLLATATPVQLYPIEAWDLLDILAQNNESIMGNSYSKWRTEIKKALEIAKGDYENISDFEYSEWVRNPFPSAEEGKDFKIIRADIGMKDSNFVILPEKINELSRGTKQRFEDLLTREFFQQNNPFIRTIVRRTRESLENSINPDTNEPYLKAVKVKLFGEESSDAIKLPAYLQEAYNLAEEFCQLLKNRTPSGGFLRTLLLKRMGSSIEAGKNTANNMLSNWGNLDENEEEEFENVNKSDIKNITPEEKDILERLVQILDVNKEKDPKYDLILELLKKKNWLERGCIIFSQFFDTAFWVATELSKEYKGMSIGIYAGGDKSGILKNGIFYKKTKEIIKTMVKNYEIKLLIGTDAASEGLNLQTLGSLINLDLPWNPTRLEQRKGRIQRIGQLHDEVYIYNMRYKDSVEDKVHEMLSRRLENIFGIFGQIPDILEDVWVQVAVGNKEEALRRINSVPNKHPFELKYHEDIKNIDWENCSDILNKIETRKYLNTGW